MIITLIIWSPVSMNNKKDFDPYKSVLKKTKI